MPTKNFWPETNLGILQDKVLANRDRCWQLCKTYSSSEWSVSSKQDKASKSKSSLRWLLLPSTNHFENQLHEQSHTWCRSAELTSFNEFLFLPVLLAYFTTSGTAKHPCFVRKMGTVPPPQGTCLMTHCRVYRKRKKPSNHLDSNPWSLSCEARAQKLCYNRCHLLNFLFLLPQKSPLEAINHVWLSFD